MRASLAIIASLAVASAAHADKPATAKDLPKAAHAFIEKHFAAKKIAAVTIDKGWGTKSFEVTLDDGSELEFNAKGEWRELEAGAGTGLPSTMLPEKISEYLTQHYPTAMIKEAARRGKGYEIELRAGPELEFDANGHFVRLDD